MKVEGGHVEDGAGRAGRAARLETGWPGSGYYARVGCPRLWFFGGCPCPLPCQCNAGRGYLERSGTHSSPPKQDTQHRNVYNVSSTYQIRTHKLKAYSYEVQVCGDVV